MLKPSNKLLFLMSILVVLGAAPVTKNAIEQTGDLTKKRSHTKYKIVALSQGDTHYSEWGSNLEDCIFLVHGVSGPMSVWEKAAPNLSSAGYRVISYDLFGRGLSDRPQKPNNMGLFRQQLNDLIESQGCKGEVNLVGSSMGAIVASDYALSAPDRINKVAIIGPAGFPIEASPAASLIQVPVIGDYLFALFGKRSLSAHNKNYYADATKWPEAAVDYAQQFKYSGYKSAVLSTMREMPIQDFRTGYEALGNLDIPVALIWGQEDRTFPVSNFEDAKNYLHPVSADIIQSAGHVPQYEQVEQTTKLLIDFFDY